MTCFINFINFPSIILYAYQASGKYVMKRLYTLCRHSLVLFFALSFSHYVHMQRNTSWSLQYFALQGFNVSIRFRKKKGRDYANSQQDYRSEQLQTPNKKQDQFCRSFPTARCDKSRKEEKLGKPQEKSPGLLLLHSSQVSP